MPIDFLGSLYYEGSKVIPFFEYVKSYGPYVASTLLFKWYFAGASNTWERDMHGRVILITGGTSGLGAAVAKDLAKRGAQIILLVRWEVGDDWLVNYITDMREQTGNPLIYAEQADLSNFYSVRKFATSWLDNSPPRRLDAIVCCAGTATPPYNSRSMTIDGVEEQLQVNYFGHYHLVTLLTPALKAQPADRDVRVIFTGCVASVMADFRIDDLDYTKRRYPSSRPWKIFGAAKLQLAMFAYEYQRVLNSLKRPDGLESNINVAVVDPGMMRSPSFRRFVGMGSVLGLLVYLFLWPIWWLFLKTSIGGAESILFALMCPNVTDEKDASYISECRVRNKPPRRELEDLDLQKKLYETTEKFISVAEKESVKNKKRQETSKSTKSSESAKSTSPEKKDAKKGAQQKKTKQK